jgi:hypothetical protein
MFAADNPEMLGKRSGDRPGFVGYLLVCERGEGVDDRSGLREGVREP